MQVRMGNVAAIEGYNHPVIEDDPENPGTPRVRMEMRKRAVTDGLHRTTEIAPPGGKSMGQVFTEITSEPRGIWANHSSAPPAWVESDSAGLAAMLSEHYGCPIGRPDWWDHEAEMDPAQLAALKEAHDAATKAGA